MFLVSIIVPGIYCCSWDLLNLYGGNHAIISLLWCCLCIRDSCRYIQYLVACVENQKWEFIGDGVSTVSVQQVEEDRGSELVALMKRIALSSCLRTIKIASEAICIDIEQQELREQAIEQLEFEQRESINRSQNGKMSRAVRLWKRQTRSLKTIRSGGRGGSKVKVELLVS